jgi:hypothetical protein
MIIIDDLYLGRIYNITILSFFCSYTFCTLYNLHVWRKMLTVRQGGERCLHLSILAFAGSSHPLSSRTCKQKSIQEVFLCALREEKRGVRDSEGLLIKSHPPPPPSQPMLLYTFKIFQPGPHKNKNSSENLDRNTQKRSQSMLS